MTHCDVHAVVCELPLYCLQDAVEDDVATDCHEGYVQVGGINILSGRLIPVTSTDLCNNECQARDMLCQLFLCKVIGNQCLCK